MHFPADRPAIPPQTALRFFAAAVVVTFHYNPDRFVNLPGFFRNWLETGYEAVTFFFVLSGFVLSYVYTGPGASGREQSLRAFFVARIARLAPAFYLSLAIALPLFALDTFAWGGPPVFQFVVHGLLVLFFVQSWWPPAALAWNPPGWSLAVEWFLYLAFPLIARLSRSARGGTFLAFAFVLAAATSAFRVLVMEPLVEKDFAWHNFAQFSPLFHLPQFIFGMALGRMHLAGPKPPPWVAAAMFVAGIAGLMAVLGEFALVPHWLRADAVLAVLYGLVILGAARPGHLFYRALSLRPLIYLGEISFSIYILHDPIAMWWEPLVLEVFGAPLPTIVDFPLYVTVVLAVSALSFRYVETPMRRRIRRWSGA